MTSIFKCARVILCVNCGTHGHIVFYDGSRSDECEFTEDFSKAIAEAVLEKKLCSEELTLLHQEISMSNVPSHKFVRRVGTIIEEFFAKDVVAKEMGKCPSSRTLH